MPTAPSDEGRDGGPRFFSWRAAQPSRRKFAILSLGAGLICFAPLGAWAETAAVARPSPTPMAQAGPKSSPAPKSLAQKKWGKLEGNAVWYDVPVNSLAHRRAGKGELTAAHNRLPLGTMVRVTHLANKKSVIVRITDRGITTRRALIDLCKEAAAQLDMLRAGKARVTVQVLEWGRGAQQALRRVARETPFLSSVLEAGPAAD